MVKIKNNTYHRGTQGLTTQSHRNMQITKKQNEVPWNNFLFLIFLEALVNMQIKYTNSPKFRVKLYLAHPIKKKKGLNTVLVLNLWPLCQIGP